MPKLLSIKEADKIASKMAEAYGLPAPQIIIDSSSSWSVKVQVYKYSSTRVIPWFSKPRRLIKEHVFYVYAVSTEDALVKLKEELEAKFDKWAKIAEDLRDSYARQEADEVLDKQLSK